MSDHMLLPIYDLESARQTILKREAPDDLSMPEVVLDGIARRFGERISPEEAVRRVIRDVRERGDQALRDWAQRIDGTALTEIAFSDQELDSASQRVPESVSRALGYAAERIRRFHEQQPAISWINSLPEGILGQLVRPVERVGIYVPGGTAPLPSTLLMCAIPAKVAGVEDMIVCTPSDDPVILQAAAVSGIRRVYHLGGAQAIAAMAYGTETVPRVDKIVGPGGLFVTIAKRMVYGAVGIDGLLGPTETVVIADAVSNPELAAVDMLAQAEHDVLASAILLTPSRELAVQVQRIVQERYQQLERRTILESSLAGRSGIVIVDDLPQAFEAANAYAPEHLCLLLEDAYQWIGHVKHAGGIFLGDHSYEVLGDYVAGPSHSMPTGGTARFASPLNVLDFVKIISLVGLTADSSRELSRQAAILARAEQLTAHAAAAEARMEES
jgi:histidinol dehydrogenase